MEIIDSVEDSKGNAGDIGRVCISNLRIMWFSLTNPKFTLCKWEQASLSLVAAVSRNINEALPCV